MEASPYLTAIQSVNGQTPGDKYKELHSIATQIVENESEKNEFIKTGDSKRVQPALLPYLRVLVGNKLQQSDAVIAALKSDDVTVIKQALCAKWFFNTSNALIRVDYFVENIIPYVSLRTRLELIKTLASCLVTEPKKADEFFGSFADFYGLEQALPLIVACSEEYIFDAILNRRINLPSRLLGVLYRRYPNLVIRYLQLGNDSNETNKEDRKQHTISLNDYRAFLPVLVKNHTHVYVELYSKSVSWRRSTNLGNTRAEFFLKNAADALIRKPTVFLELLPLKLVTNKLSTQQFETMYENLFPDHANEFILDSMLDYLKYYPEEKKLSLIREKYRKNYNKELLEVQNIDSFKLYKLLRADEKEEMGRKMIEPYLNTPDYYDHLCYLPPKEAIPLLKERISKLSDKRIQYIKKMIESCAIYDSEDDLRDLLCYYNVRHKNEQANVLHEFFDKLMSSFDLKTLPRSHWSVLREILQRAYVRGDLFNASANIYTKLFKNALHFYLKHCKTNVAGEDSRNFLEKLVSVVLEFYMEHNMKWEFISDCTEIERDCLQNFLAVLPQKYPATHSAWNNFENKLSLVSYLVQTIHSFNVKNMYTVQSKKRYSKGSTTTTDSEGNEVKYTKFAIKSYDWLVDIVTDILKNRDKASKKKYRTKCSEFRRILQKHDAEFYQSLVDNDPDLLYDCETSDAVVILKRNSHKILSKWELYVKECKTLLHGRSKSTKRFVTALKWHQVIPIKFIEQCLQQIEDKGSILILGILLEGEAFTKIVQSYLPKDKTIDLEDETAKQAYDMTTSLIKAMNCTNPPVALDVFLKFCQGDYVPLGSQMLKNIGQRVPTNRILEFASKLVDNKAIAGKKLGIRLMFQVASKTESRMFLTKIWSTEKNASIREVLVQMIFEVFQHSASQESWEMVKMCIKGLTGDDLKALECLIKINVVDKNFVVDYIVELLKKIDEMPEDKMDKISKTLFISELCSSVDESIMHRLSEELQMDIVKRVIFEYNTDFVINLYIMSEDSKLEERLKNLIVILKEKVKSFDKPEEKKARHYPTNCGFHRFFESVYETLNENNKKIELKERIVDEMLKFMTTTLQPIQIPYCYILMKMYKDSLVSKTPEECGTRFAESVKHIIKDFGSEVILRIVATAFKTLKQGKTIYTQKMEERDLVLNIIEAMMKIDQHLGSIVGIMALDRYQVDKYSDKYDFLIKTWREMNDVTVQAMLNEFHTDGIFYW